MFISSLLTKYILLPLWARFVIFIFFYFLFRQLLFFGIDNSFVECMQRSSENVDPETFSNERKTNTIEELRRLRIRNFDFEQQILELNNRRLMLYNSSLSHDVISDGGLQTWFRLTFNEEKSTEELKSMFSYNTQVIDNRHVCFFNMRQIVAKYTQDIVNLKNQAHSNLTQMLDLETRLHMEKNGLIAEAKTANSLLQEAKRSCESFERKLEAKEMAYRALEERTIQQIAEAKATAVLETRMVTLNEALDVLKNSSSLKEAKQTVINITNPQPISPISSTVTTNNIFDCFGCCKNQGNHGDIQAPLMENNIDSTIKADTCCGGCSIGKCNIS